MTKVITKISAAKITPAVRQGGIVRAILTPNTVGSTSGFMGTITVPAHQFVAEHYHPYSDEFLFLVDGAITLRTGDDSMELNAGEAVMIPRGHRHRFDNLSDVDAFGVFHICPLAPRPEIGHVETEPVPFPDAAPPRVGGSR